MKNWLKENWLKILIALCVILFLLFCANLIVGIIELVKDNVKHEEDIKAKDEKIQEKQGNIKIKEAIIIDLKEGREKDKAASDKKIKEMEDNQKKELSRISSERDEWKAKVKEMPASTVVIKVRTILKTDEIWERPDGILFSLAAAKDCLAILGDFSLVEERDRFRDDYFTAMSTVKDLKNIITVDEEIFYYFDDISLTKDEIDDIRKDKFNLSESNKRKSWWKGIKAGVIVGGTLGLILGLVLGK